MAGMSSEAIGQAIGVHQATVGKMLKSPAGQDVLADLEATRLNVVQDKVWNKIHQSTSDMLDIELELARNAESDAVKHNAATWILELAGFTKRKDGPVETIPQIVVNFNDAGYRSTDGHMPALVADGQQMLLAEYEEIDDGDESGEGKREDGSFREEDQQERRGGSSYQPSGLGVPASGGEDLCEEELEHEILGTSSS